MVQLKPRHVSQPSALSTERLIWAANKKTQRAMHAGESAGGVAPPAALRTGRDSLLSSGPHSPAGGECDEVPVGEEGGLVAVDRLQPLGRSGVLAAESFELVHGPPG
jgi:hypothetical protein